MVFEKLHKFMGKNIKALVDRGGEQPHCLRLQRNRVFYVRDDIMRRATNVSRPATAGCQPPPHNAAGSEQGVAGGLRMQVARDKLVALGTCIGKFTHSGKFRVTIGALDLLAQYAKYKVRGWVGAWRVGEPCVGTAVIAGNNLVGQECACCA